MNLSIKKTLSAALLLVVLTGCSTLGKMPSEEQVNAVKTVSIVNKNSGDLVGVMTPANSAAGAGLGLLGVVIDSAIDSSRASAAERKAQTMRGLGENIDHNVSVANAIKNSFTGANGVNIVDSGSDATFEYTSHTEFSPDLKTLQVRVEGVLQLLAGGKKEKYIRSAAWQTHSEVWDSALFEQSVKTGSDEVAALLVDSYFQPGYFDSGTASSEKVSYLWDHTAENVKFAASMVGASDDGLSKRYLLKNKALLSTTHDTIEDENLNVNNESYCERNNSCEE